MTFADEGPLTGQLPSDTTQPAYGRFGRVPEVAHAVASRVEQTFACQLTGDQQLPLLADWVSRQLYPKAALQEFTLL